VPNYGILPRLDRSIEAAFYRHYDEAVFDDQKVVAVGWADRRAVPLTTDRSVVGVRRSKEGGGRRLT